MNKQEQENMYDIDKVSQYDLILTEGVSNHLGEIERVFSRKSIGTFEDEKTPYNIMCELDGALTDGYKLTVEKH